MSLRFQSKIKHGLSASALAAGILLVSGLWTGAVAQKQGDASYGTPLAAGQMTLEDVLETHPLPKKPALQAPALAAPGSTVPPVMTTPAAASTESDMLMQGMKTVLQQSGSSSLTPPQLPGGAPAITAAPAPLTPPVPATTEPLAPPPPAAPPSSGIAYQPGQAPKNLATGAPLSLAPTPAEATAEQAFVSDRPVASSPQEASVPSSPSMPTDVATPGCAPHVEKWTKNCADAGYPDTFTGQISGETHVVCPGNTLQDVWVANSCAAPDNNDNNAPLTAPSPVAASSASSVPASLDETPVSGGASVMSSMGNISQSDGSCGPANGLAAAAKPVGDLCASGEVSDVVGDGPWRWSCKGISGGMTVSCAAPVDENAAASASLTPAPAPIAEDTSASLTPEASAPLTAEDGQCGPSDNAPTDQIPTSGLCAKGIVSRVSGEGPWTWACSGRNGGQAAACTANRKTDGVCGAANGASTDGMPMSELCNAGYASAITGNGPWNWTCSGLYGGSAALCSAAPKQDAVCGTASLYGHREAPQNDLCSVGKASSVDGGGPWTWTCVGMNGGSPVSCASPIKVSGGCGAANGVAVSSAPEDNLCAYGKPTRVTGTGPWNWSCSGVAGGDSETCTAPVRRPGAAVAETSEPSTASTEAPSPSAAPATSVASNEDAFVRCGSASELAAFDAPSKDLCAKGKASDVTGSNPWSWTCADDAGHKASCSTLSPAGSFSEAVANAKSHNGEMPAPNAAPRKSVASMEERATCGAASGQGTVSKPVSALCSVGKPSSVQGSGPWTWTCAKGGEKTSCEAPKLVDAICGAASGTTQRSTPVAELCNAGSATPVQGAGPWLWSCVGTGGGVSVSCSAMVQTQTHVDGACGAAASTATLTPPTANLCDGGMPSAVNGHGPWTWTCSGLNGGTASLCSAQKNLPQAPPPPGPAVNGLCGFANGATAVMQPEEGLCTSGSPTAVSGNGPWNWNCLGANGGMTVSCTALLQPPAPIVGACGSATGQPTLSAPRSGLCSAGISSAVSGRGPWTWSCSGTNGGGAVACVAPVAGPSSNGLPSMVTPSGEAPVPQASATMPVSSAGLVTPRLSAGSLPPLSPGTAPPIVPSKPFDAPPEPSALPPVPMPADPQPPSFTPDLPEGTEPLQPPPVRDTLKPSPALRPPAAADIVQPVPGNHYTLPDSLSTVSFTAGSENIDNAALPQLDRLASDMKANGAVRITLTSYAGVSETISPRDARRLSLTRALAIRDYLTAKGVSSGRIDVRALGANVPTGDPDRVDVTAN